MCMYMYIHACFIFLWYATRFYSRLPEVRRKKLEEKRSAAYAANRQKAKVYQEVHVYIVWELPEQDMMKTPQ